MIDLNTLAIQGDRVVAANNNGNRAFFFDLERFLVFDGFGWCKGNFFDIEQRRDNNVILENYENNFDEGG